MQKERGGRYLVLDAMRGVGAIAVLSLHLSNFLDIAPNGYLAVDFFFALSGFVLAKIYEQKLRAGMTPLAFMVARYKRLLPTFAIGVLLGTIGYLIYPPEGKTVVHALVYTVFNGLMLPFPYTGGNFFPLNPPGWSLFLELIINAAFAVILFKWSKGVLVAVAIYAAIVLLSLIHGYGGVEGWTWATLHVGIARVAFSFIVGMVLARVAPVERRVSYWSVLPLLALLAVLYSPIYDSPVWLPCIVIFFVNPLILAAGAALELPKALAPVGRFLGDISYPLYAIHYPLLVLCEPSLREIGWPAGLKVAVFMLVAVAAAVVINIAMNLANSALRYRVQDSRA